MLVTEEEARELCCIHKVVATMHMLAAIGHGADITVDSNESPRCIASQCMAFRWESTGSDMGRQHVQPGAERRGYCGLAGRPEA